jgi:hypothetical protein
MKDHIIYIATPLFLAQPGAEGAEGAKAGRLFEETVGRTAASSMTPSLCSGRGQLNMPLVIYTRTSLTWAPWHRALSYLRYACILGICFSLASASAEQLSCQLQT